MLQEYLEQRWERYKIRMVMTAIVVFLISFMMSCQELKYMIKGKVVDARLVKDEVQSERTRNGSTRQKHVILYWFDDNGTNRQEYHDVPLDWQKPGDFVKVQYIAGREGQSRLLGEHNYGWISVFFGSIVACGILIWLMVRSTA